MQPCDREGIFKATITEAGIKEMESGAVAIAIKAHLTEIWNGQEQSWEPWAEYGMEAEGDLWIVKKTGQLNQPAVESLIRYAGWDGNLESIAAETWHPTPCQVTIKREEYDQKTRFKISFVNELNRVPGGLSNVTPEKTKELQTRFGGQFRAIAGNVRRNGSTPSAGAPAQPSRPPRPLPPPEPEPVAASIDSDDIPF